MLPQIQLVINGPIIPHAPADAVNALGKNDQILCVVPSEQLVIVRMGDNTQGADVSIVFLDSVWQHLRSIICSPTSVANESTHDTSLVRGLGTVMPGSNVYMVDLTGQAMLVCSGSQMFNPALLTNRSVLCTTTVLDAVGNPTVYVLVGN